MKIGGVIEGRAMIIRFGRAAAENSGKLDERLHSSPCWLCTKLGADWPVYRGSDLALEVRSAL